MEGAICRQEETKWREQLHQLAAETYGAEPGHTVFTLFLSHCFNPPKKTIVLVFLTSQLHPVCVSAGDLWNFYRAVQICVINQSVNSILFTHMDFHKHEHSDIWAKHGKDEHSCCTICSLLMRK